MKPMILLLGAIAATWTTAAAAEVPQSACRNHVVHVVSVTQAGLEHSADLADRTLARLEQSAVFHPDIACLPELFPRRGPETIPGEITGRVARWAREHSSYVIFGIKTASDGKVYNSAVLIDRRGNIAGEFRKMHPTEGELAEGTAPGGTEAQVFETDFGVIGIQICFDVNWWENWKRLKQKGAGIVFFPSAYPALRQLSALALTNQVYVVSSAGRGSSNIYDITGKVLASSGSYQQWAGAALPMGKRLFEIDFNAEKVRAIEEKYGPKVAVDWLHEDDWFTLASLDRDLTVNDLIAEFGLTPLDEYRARATKAVEKARAVAGRKSVN